ncbi:Cysteine-rich RLK (RECEPTOR-like protein kinase) 8 [Gossypium australe]|uniref:Cysteine-rich RLK (RECEPTOR-like protein kinase) 8 n=1 Tax=Gossypium australe TaxID=47621 RepID=A0A5B6UXT8_9ROSI|nr:Cysteine-rich RLK (RECEPTOR-like protein kinase) 8 [Gossypium australe]
MFFEKKVCKLKKALYGLKQSPRAWFERFTKVMLAMQCKQSHEDHTLFIKHSKGGVSTLLAYVDDIIITRIDQIERETLKKCLVKEFEIKELERLKYINFLTKEIDILVPYKARHSISKSIHAGSKRETLVGISGRGILFKKNKGLLIEAYIDADYASSVVDRKSTSRYCTFLGGNLVTWRSKKQLWEGPMKLYCGNKSTINIAHNLVQHDHTKHIEVDRHFIKEKLDSDLICTPYIASSNQLEDVLTKGMPTSNFEDITCKMGMENIYSPS